MTTYIIKIILCSALFVLTYKILFEKERMHQFNRYYLLSGLLLSFIIPMVTFHSYTQVLPTVENAFLSTNILLDSGSIQKTAFAGNTNYIFSISTAIYATITALLLFRFIINLKAIIRKTGNSAIIPYENAKIILIAEDLIPHSFLNYIFINKEDYTCRKIENEILVHEYAHVQQKHSYDILFLEIFHAIFWFNPFLFLYRKSIKLNHEFLADEAVINAYQNTTGYQYLLIDKAKKTTCF